MAGQESFTKGRSPRYPRISLETAVGYARRLYDGAHRSTVDPDTAAQLMGFRSQSGASAVALGAVRQFGLVEGLRGSLKISDLALSILQPRSQDEEVEARHNAAFKPEVFEAIVSHFDGELPRANEPIKAHLIRSLGFSKSGAEDCIISLRKTISELESHSRDLVQKVADNESHNAGSLEGLVPSPADVSAAPPSSTPQPNGELVRIPLTRECVAELRLIGEVSSSAIDRLVQYIELMKGVWADD